MDLEKVYYDADGNECNILHAIKSCPEWAANRIQKGENAIDTLASQQPVQADGEYVPFDPEWEKEMMRWSKKDLVAELRRRLT